MISFKILCRIEKVAAVIGKSGSTIAAIRQETGARVTIHDMLPGDGERIVEISNISERGSSFLPAAEKALFLVLEKIVGTNKGFEVGEYGNDVVMRLVVPDMHVRCLIGKELKESSIIEQMRVQTKTKIKILSRNTTTPHCVSMKEKIVQVIGDVSGVKSAVKIISSRLREIQESSISYTVTSPSSSLESSTEDPDNLKIQQDRVLRGDISGVKSAVKIISSPLREIQESPNSYTETSPYSIEDPNDLEIQLDNVFRSPDIQAALQFCGILDENCHPIPMSAPQAVEDVRLVEAINNNESKKRKIAQDVEPAAIVDAIKNHESKCSGLNRIMPIVVKSTLEVVIPNYPASELVNKSEIPASISELSGATVKSIDKIFQISGTPEQVERAQWILQGVILGSKYLLS